MTNEQNTSAVSLFKRIGKKEWKNLNGHDSYLMTDEDLQKLRALNEPLTQEEIEDIYYPLCQFLHLQMAHYWKLHQEVDRFLKNETKKLPFIIGIAGSVAAGKSTTARVLQKVLGLHPSKLKVELVTTDGFLLPNKTLIEKGILNRKGFPESYDARKLLSFLAAVKSGKEKVYAPVYSHLSYDVVENEQQVIEEPDILIIEGINVLQVNMGRKQKGPRVFVSDFFDFSIYVDAGASHLKEWYISRFESLRQTAFQDEKSYFHRYANLKEEDSKNLAISIWNEINRPNLLKNIQPTKYRADLILEKGQNHLVKGIKLRMN